MVGSCAVPEFRRRRHLCGTFCGQRLCGGIIAEIVPVGSVFTALSSVGTECSVDSLLSRMISPSEGSDTGGRSTEGVSVPPLQPARLRISRRIHIRLRRFTEYHFPSYRKNLFSFADQILPNGYHGKTKMAKLLHYGSYFHSKSLKILIKIPFYSHKYRITEGRKF